MTPQEIKKREVIMKMEMEALDPKRIERISTTDFVDKSPYVYGKTLRLRNLDELAKEGIPPEKIEGVKEWRSAAALTEEVANKLRQEKEKQKVIMQIQMEDLNPKRIEKISTTDFKDKSPYVEGKTLRLRKLDELEQDPSLTSKKLDGVKGWRSAAAKSDNAEKR